MFSLHGFCPVTPCKAHERRISPRLEPYLGPLLDSLGVEPLLNFSFSVLNHHCGPTVKGELSSPPIRAPMIGKATTGRSPGIPEGPFEADSPTAIHPISATRTPQDCGLFFKVYCFRSAVSCANRITSCKMWLFTTHRRSWVQGGLYLHPPPLRNSQELSSGYPFRPSTIEWPRAQFRPSISPLGNVLASIYPSQLLLTPWKWATWFTSFI
jgi:hypothetical protein